MGELRRGMLKGYRDLLGIPLPEYRLRITARLVSGASVLLVDTTPLTAAILSAVSFYVYAAGEKDATSPPPKGASQGAARGASQGARHGGAPPAAYGASTTVWPEEEAVGADTPRVSEIKSMLARSSGSSRPLR